MSLQQSCWLIQVYAAWDLAGSASGKGQGVGLVREAESNSALISLLKETA